MQGHSRRSGKVARHGLMTPLKWLAALLVFLSTALWSQAQTQSLPDYSVRSTTRVILVDAIVTDGKGQSVTGLGANDFSVLEDGKPQKISFFSYESQAKRDN